MKTKDRPIQKHPAALEWETFRERNPEMFDLGPLGIPPGGDFYLTVRLQRTFEAGLAAGKRIAEGERSAEGKA